MQVEPSPENFKLETIDNTHNTLEKSEEENFPNKIDQSIKNIIEKEGFIKYNIYKKCISTNGGNYLGDLYEIDVKGKTIRDDKELNIFVKNMVDEESVKVISLPDVYRTELFTYKELSKIFEELQDGANVPEEERYKMVKTYESSDTEMVLMENISKKGFKTYNRMDLVSLQFLELCVKNIARFHGLSFVIKEKHPEFFDKKIKPLKCPLIFEDELKGVIQNICSATVNHVDEDLKEKLVELYKNYDTKMVEYLNDETIKTCLCHGDYRPNNIMMKEEDGELQEIISIDYQTIYYGCPVFDLLYLIYSCTDRDFRKKHMSYLKDLYYDTLYNFLKYFNLDADVVYPRHEFERVFKEKLDYGLLIALQLLPFLFVCQDNLPDITVQGSTSFQVDYKIKDRMQGVIEDFIELGFI